MEVRCNIAYYNGRFYIRKKTKKVKTSKISEKTFLSLS